MRSSPEHVRQIISQWFPDNSEAARYWDSLKPEWRGLVLHAASVYSHEVLNASLAKCNWCELYARLDHRRMMQLRAGNGGAVAVRSVRAKAGEAIADASALPANSVSFCYADAAFSLGYEATILDVGGGWGDYRYALPAAPYRVQPFKALRATLKTDRAHSRALARHSMAKKIFRRPKSHYTVPACGFWIIKIFQFYFSTNQTARPRQCWRLYVKPEMKRLKRISVFFSFLDQKRSEWVL